MIVTDEIAANEIIEGDNKLIIPIGSSLSQEICRLFFETIFQKKFISVRPNWLKNKLTGSNLELDGYCADLNLAFEHNGHFHNNKKQTKRDKIKNNLCKKLGIKLVVIPNLFTDIGISNLKKFLENEFSKLGIPIPYNFESIRIKIPKSVYNESYFEKCKQIAENNGGKILSDYYINSTTKIQISCINNHVWWGTPVGLVQGYWCSQCYHNSKKHTIEYVFKICESKNIKCISDIYENAETKLTWQCLTCGNVWSSPFRAILANKLCSICGNLKWLKQVRYSESEIEKILFNYNVMCYDYYKYINIMSKINWQCNICNNIFNTSFQYLKRKIKNNFYLCANCKFIP